MLKQLNGWWKWVIVCVLAAGFAGNAHAIILTNQCSAGQALDGISVSDVSGDLGGATDCFGAFGGTEPRLSSDLTFGANNWSYLGGVDVVDEKSVTVGEDFGQFLDISPGAQSGLWFIDPSLLSASSFMIVLQTASNPTWAAFLFDGAAADSGWGEWSVAWNDSLSAMSIYVATATPSVPEPSSILLLAITLIVTGAKLRRIRSR